MGGKKKVIQYRDNCIGCNSCTEHAPGNWEIDPVDGKANLKRAVETDGVFVAEIFDPEVEANKLAGRDCPAGIIHVENEKGEDITYR